MAFTRCVTQEVAGAGISRQRRVPRAWPRIRFWRKLRASKLLQSLLHARPWAAPRKVANVIVFLACDLSSYMTGEAVSVSSQHP